MDRINLRNMAFYGYHGNLASENELGQRFFVDISMALDLSKAGQSDNLEDSINYAEIYERTKQIVGGKPHRLIERVGTLIAEAIWGHYEGLIGLSVTVRKPEAPIPGLFDHVEVVITRGHI